MSSSFSDVFWAFKIVVPSFVQITIKVEIVWVERLEFFVRVTYSLLSYVDIHDVIVGLLVGFVGSRVYLLRVEDVTTSRIENFKNLLR